MTETTTGRPLCDAEEFDHLVDQLVAMQTPRMFAVVQELGDREDARVAAWGLAHETRADVVGAGGNTFLALGSPDTAAAVLGLREGLSARIVWVGTSVEPPR